MAEAPTQATQALSEVASAPASQAMSLEPPASQTRVSGAETMPAATPAAPRHMQSGSASSAASAAGGGGGGSSRAGGGRWDAASAASAPRSMAGSHVSSRLEQTADYVTRCCHFSLRAHTTFHFTHLNSLQHSLHGRASGPRTRRRVWIRSAVAGRSQPRLRRCCSSCSSSCGGGCRLEFCVRRRWLCISSKSHDVWPQWRCR